MTVYMEELGGTVAAIGLYFFVISMLAEVLMAFSIL